jgi:hypothetical protein
MHRSYNKIHVIADSSPNAQAAKRSIIKKNSISVVLALDPDDGGEKATIKYVEDFLKNNNSAISIRRWRTFNSNFYKFLEEIS